MTALGDARHAIIGCWQLVGYQDRTSEAEPWTDPFGGSPLGLGVYHQSGLLSMQVFADPLAAEPEFQVVSYLGAFEVRDAAVRSDGFAGVLEHHMQAASDPAFLTEDVARPFVISGDQLLLGDDHTWRRTFRRVP